MFKLDSLEDEVELKLWRGYSSENTEDIYQEIRTEADLLSKGRLDQDHFCLNPLISPKVIPIKSVNRVIPNIFPTTLNMVRVKRFSPIFNQKCALVTAEINKKEFIYFDPEFSPGAYENISRALPVKLAAIGAYASIDFEYNPKDKKHSKEGISSKEKKSPLPMYGAVFRIKSIISKLQSFDNENPVRVRAISRNPLNFETNLELYASLEEDYTPERPILLTKFVFCGTVD